ncbi:YtpI family protein [Bacillus sp. Marseille-P3661]|uniref:YtpI family protein n=1 Tax=Bacillus sp. Marseille-P3661 TaxID=1936234 RepID=UPI000C860CA0|nr:YtpI family protein [Bacillus sp. Marseille-P3661]
MPIFGVLSIICIALYLFFRVKYFRVKQPNHRQWLSSKATITLGLFMLFFGLDQIIIWKTTTANIVGMVFLIVGLIYSIQGFRMYRFYQPRAIKETEEQQNT